MHLVAQPNFKLPVKSLSVVSSILQRSFFVCHYCQVTCLHSESFCAICDSCEEKADFEVIDFSNFPKSEINYLYENPAIPVCYSDVFPF